MSRTPKTKAFLERSNLREDSEEAQFMRGLEKESNRLRIELEAVKRDLRTMREELTGPAGNRRLMQIARPARTCLNLIEEHLK